MAEARVTELEAWKDSAMQVMNAVDLQGIAKELGLPLGVDIPPCIIPGIRKFKEAAEQAVAKERATLREIIDMTGAHSIENIDALLAAEGWDDTPVDFRGKLKALHARLANPASAEKGAL